jgi:anti-sigma-K factor RskA
MLISGELTPDGIGSLNASYNNFSYSPVLVLTQMNLEREHSEKRLQLENALEQARFEAARAYRQYDASDPENRVVTAELERRWNERRGCRCGLNGWRRLIARRAAVAHIGPESAGFGLARARRQHPLSSPFRNAFSDTKTFQTIPAAQVAMVALHYLRSGRRLR